MSARAVAALLLACAVGGGCREAEPRTQIMVVLEAEAQMRSLTDSLEVVVKGSSGREGSLRTERFLRIFAGGAEGIAWPRQIAVAPLDDDASRIFELIGTARDAAGTEIGRVRAIGGFVAHQTLMLLLVMEDVCREELCMEGTTCRQDLCEDAHFDAELLPLYDPAFVTALRERELLPFVPASCESNHGGCDLRASCGMLDDDVVCGECPLGYVGEGRRSCEDVDECRAAAPDCDPGIECVNVPGSYRCGDCPAGFVGGGVRGCVDVDECATDHGGCDARVACVNLPGTRRCGECPPGWSGSGESTCFDVDECDVDEGGCDPMTICTNTPGGRECSACPGGYVGTGETGCSDFDECDVGNGGCDARTLCTNTDGGRSCGACPPGYQGDGESGCADVNECATANGGCDLLAGCTNTDGGFGCGSCPASYAGDGATGCSRLLTALLPPGTALAFVPATTSYVMQADALDDVLWLEPLAGPRSTVRVNGVVVPQDQPYPVSIAPGVSSITVTVSEAGHPDTTYTLDVTRSSGVTQDHYLKAASPGPTRFGRTLALEGDVLAVGGPSGQGALHVYRRVGALWQEDAVLATGVGRDTFTVQISGATLAFAARGDDTSDNLVRVYTYEGGSWVEQLGEGGAPIEPPGGLADDGFGAALALAGDYLAISEPGYLGDNGQVHVLHREDGEWSVVQTLVSSRGREGNFRFGQALALDASSPDGMVLAALIAERPPSTGGVDLFRFDGERFVHEDQVTPSPTFYGEAYDSLSEAVLLLAGDELFVGAPLEAGGSSGVNPSVTMPFGDGVGAVFGFEHALGAWSQSVHVKPPAIGPMDLFGASIALEGDRLVVGAPGESSAHRGTGGGSTEQADDSAPNAGAVYVLERSAGEWAYAHYLKASNAEAQDGFGTAVALDGTTLVCGAPGEDSAAVGFDGDQDDESGGERGAVYEL